MRATLLLPFVLCLSVCQAPEAEIRVEAMTHLADSAVRSGSSGDSAGLTSDVNLDADDGTSSTSDDGGESVEGDLDGCEEIHCSVGSTEYCPEGQKCTAWRCGDGCCVNSTRCVTVTGEKQRGEPCVRDGVKHSDDCAPTLFCMPDAGASGMGGPGHCIQICEPEPGGLGNCEALGFPGAHCFQTAAGVLPVCRLFCDPIEQNCEDPKDVCYLSGDGYFCTRPTDPSGGAGVPGELGEECSAEQGCERGMVCAPAALSASCNNHSCDSVDACGCCMLVCDLRDGEPNRACDAGLGEQCKPALHRPPAGLEHVGVCGNGPRGGVNERPRPLKLTSRLAPLIHRTQVPNSSNLVR